jgi:propanol-preferring alcohol dehydrogenase
MKAAVLHETHSPLVLEDVEIPSVGPEEALLHIKACGICHTDLNYMDGLKPTGKIPIILGHEAAGVVSEVGKKVMGFVPGDRVVVYFVLACGKCDYCMSGQDNLCDMPIGMFGITRDGGFAEYANVPARSLVKVPKGISFEEAALLGCGGLTSYHALKDLAQVNSRDTVAIYGLGGLGMSAIQIAKASDARVIAVDIVEEKLKLAEKLGADCTLNANEINVPAKIRELTNGKGADAALNFTPNPKVIEEAVKSIRKTGLVVCVGWGLGDFTFSLNVLDLIGGELRVVGCRSGRKQNLSELVELLSNGRLNFKYLISHRMPLTEINSAIDISRKSHSIRTVINP